MRKNIQKWGLILAAVGGWVTACSLILVMNWSERNFDVVNQALTKSLAERSDLMAELVRLEDRLQAAEQRASALEDRSADSQSKLAGLPDHVREKLAAGAVAKYMTVKRAKLRLGPSTQTQELAPLLYHGDFNYRVKDARVFIDDICGNNNLYTTDAVNNYIRGYFNENIIGLLSQYTLRDVYGKLKETSKAVEDDVKSAFEKIGLELGDVNFLKIDTEEKYRDRLFFMQTGGVGAAGVLASETQKEVAKEIGAKGIEGQALLDLGYLHKVKGRTDKARDYFSRAIKIFEECEAEMFLKQAKEALASLA